jgi:hypothetical protein
MIRAEAPELELRYHVPRSQVWSGSRGRQRGNTHAHTLAELELGRLKRRRGQALCGRAGWYERPPEGEHELEPAGRCPRCVDVAERYGLAWP